MPQSCSAVNCTHTSRTCVLKRFPRDNSRVQKWIANICTAGWKMETFPQYTMHVLQPWHRVCECHFDEQQFENRRQDGVRKLRPDAVPTVFATQGNEMPKKSSKHKRKIKWEDSPMDEYQKLIAKMDIIRESSDDEPTEIQSIPEESISSALYNAKPLRKSSKHKNTIQLQNYTKYKKSTVYMEPLDGEPNNIEIVREVPALYNLEASEDMAKLRRENYRLKRELSKARSELERVKSSLNKLWRRDQFEYLSKNIVRKWSTETLTEALQLRDTCGLQGYNNLLLLGLPYPSYSALCKHVQKMSSHQG